MRVALNLSNVRCQLLNKNWDEESQSEFAAVNTFGEMLAFLGANRIEATFKMELTEAFKIAKEEDDKIKAKKSGANAAKADSKKKPKKNAAPAAPPGI